MTSAIAVRKNFPARDPSTKFSCLSLDVFLVGVASAGWDKSSKRGVLIYQDDLLLSAWDLREKVMEH